MQSYKHRGKVVKEGKEALLWAEITPNLMSEGDVYVQHPPSHRSDLLNKFIKKLDQWLDSRIDSKKHPHLGPRLGSPRDKVVPPGCKKWMIKTSRASTNAGQEGKDIEDVGRDQPVGQVVDGASQDADGDRAHFGVIQVNQDSSSSDLSLTDYSYELL